MADTRAPVLFGSQIAHIAAGFLDGMKCCAHAPGQSIILASWRPNMIPADVMSPKAIGRRKIPQAAFQTAVQTYGAHRCVRVATIAAFPTHKEHHVYQDRL